jgi:hypothetical protein
MSSAAADAKSFLAPSLRPPPVCPPPDWSGGSVNPLAEEQRTAALMRALDWCPTPLRALISGYAASRLPPMVMPLPDFPLSVLHNGRYLFVTVNSSTPIRVHALDGSGQFLGAVGGSSIRGGRVALLGEDALLALDKQGQRLHWIDVGTGGPPVDRWEFTDEQSVPLSSATTIGSAPFAIAVCESVLFAAYSLCEIRLYDLSPTVLQPDPALDTASVPSLASAQPASEVECAAKAAPAYRELSIRLRQRSAICTRQLCSPFHFASVSSPSRLFVSCHVSASTLSSIACITPADGTLRATAASSALNSTAALTRVLATDQGAAPGGGARLFVLELGTGTIRVVDIERDRLLAEWPQCQVSAAPIAVRWESASRPRPAYPVALDVVDDMLVVVSPRELRVVPLPCELLT